MRTFSALCIALITAASCLWAQSSWQPVPMPGAKQISAFYASPEGELFAASADGIFRRSSENTWERVVQNIYGNITNFRRVEFGGRSSLLAATTQGGILRSVDNGATWAQSNKGLGTVHVNVIYQTNDGVVLAGTSYGGVYRSDDGGETWVQNGMEGEHITGFVQTREGKILLSSYRGIFISDKGHSPWKESVSGLTNRVIECLLAAPDGSLLAGGYNVGPCAPGGMFKSDDNGTTWNKIGFENQHIKALLSTPKGIFAGTWCGGVFRSADNGKEWMTLNDGLNEQCIQGISLTTDGVLYAGCYGAQNTTSMYNMALEQNIIAGESTPLLPLIEEVSPNPISDVARIRFVVEQKCLVSLHILNNVGETIATVVSETKSPGSYTAEWNAGQMENGMYVIRIQAGKRVETLPVVVVK